MKNIRIFFRLLSLILALSATPYALAYDFIADGIAYKVINTVNLTCAVVKADKEYSGDIVIPETVSYRGKILTVTEVGYPKEESGFDENIMLTSVRIPKTVENIHTSFYGCTNLREVILPRKYKHDIPSFTNCSSLKSINIPDLASGITSFKGCTALTSISLPPRITKIPEACFAGCENLSTIQFPNSLVSIGIEAFSGCKTLTSVIIPNTVTQLGHSAFMNCSSLKSVQLSENLECLDFGTFIGCDNLSSIDILESIKTVIVGADDMPNKKTVFSFPPTTTLIIHKCPDFDHKHFDDSFQIYRRYDSTSSTWSLLDWDPMDFGIYYGYLTFYAEMIRTRFPKYQLRIGAQCSSIKLVSRESDNTPTIICEATTPPKDKESGSYISPKQYMNCEVYVPDESVELYKEAPLWSGFWNIKPISEYQASISSAEISTGSARVIGRYNVRGEAVSDDYKGLTIVRLSDGTSKKIINR